MFQYVVTSFGRNNATEMMKQIAEFFPPLKTFRHVFEIHGLDHNHKMAFD